MRLRAKGSRNYHFQLEIVNEILNFMFEQFRKFLTRKSFMLSWASIPQEIRVGIFGSFDMVPNC